MALGVGPFGQTAEPKLGTQSPRCLIAEPSGEASGLWKAKHSAGGQSAAIQWLLSAAAVPVRSFWKRSSDMWTLGAPRTQLGLALARNDRTFCLYAARDLASVPQWMNGLAALEHCAVCRHHGVLQVTPKVSSPESD